MLSLIGGQRCSPVVMLGLIFQRREVLLLIVATIATADLKVKSAVSLYQDAGIATHWFLESSCGTKNALFIDNLSGVQYQIRNPTLVGGQIVRLASAASSPIF